MIGWLQGRVVEKDQAGKLVINVNGVGYDVETSQQTFLSVEEHAETLVILHIHTVVREDALLLYGFLDKQERALFRALLKVNGVGPKVAMGILSAAPHAEFISAILQQNIVYLTKLPGIGKKTAERLMVELKDNIQALYQSENLQIPALHATHGEQAQAISALESLGYKTPDILKVIKKIDDGDKSCEQLIRKALQLLSPQ